MPNEEEAKKILDAMMDYWYIEILNHMASPPYPDFDEALTIFMDGMKNG